MATTYAQRFAQHETELRAIANSLGRADIFDRDLNGDAGDGVPPRSDDAIRDAIDGVGWYLEEEHEHDGESGYNNDPRVAQYRQIVAYINAR